MTQHCPPLPNISEAEREQALARFDLLRPFFEQGVPLSRLAQQHGLALRTARRWVRQYRESGLVGLVRKARIDRGVHRRLSPELRLLIESLVLQTPQPTVAFVHRQVVAMAQKQGWSVPSYASVYNIIQQLEPSAMILAHRGAEAEPAVMEATMSLFHQATIKENRPVAANGILREPSSTYSGNRLMAVDTSDLDLRLVRKADGLELDLLALQGFWTETQYLKLTDQTNHLIEFTDGRLEVLHMPTLTHQMILAYLYRRFFAFIEAHGGIVVFAPFRVRVGPTKFREPDLSFLLDERDPRKQDPFWWGADLVVEIVSPDNPKRDTEEKPLDYAAAGIPEYWIVNPLDETLSVLTLQGDSYTTHGVFHRGMTATSPLLPDFTIHVADMFDAK